MTDYLSIPPEQQDIDNIDYLKEGTIIRVGDRFEKNIISYDVDGRPYSDIAQLQKETIIDKYGKDTMAKVPFFDKAVIVPSHINFQQVYGNCINRYRRLEIKPIQGEHPSWNLLFKRVFGEQFELGMDYITIAYRYPTQILPVLCLVSVENHTGKSTFGNALQYLFGLNVGFCSQDDLNSAFNPWIRYLFAVFEEISETKATLNKIKNISTARSARLNEKYQPQIDFRPFVKMIVLSNNDRNFVKANKEDIRYWVRRLQPISAEEYDPLFEEKLKEEAPAFLHTLHNLELSTAKQSRMWFAPELIHTEALDKVRAESRCDAVKDLEIMIQEKIEDAEKSFYATVSQIRDWVGFKYTINEIARALNELGYEKQPQMRFTDSYGTSRNGTPFHFIKPDSDLELAYDDESDDLPF